MKAFFKAVNDFLVSMAQARAAAALSRSGDYENARNILKD